MGANVTFDAATKIIQVTKTPVLIDGELVVDIDFKIDIYSDGKEDFLLSHILQARGFPLRPVGGDPLPGAKKLGSTFFVASDWKIRPYPGNHRFRLNGNVYSEDGTSPFIPPDGAFSVFFEQQVSSLVDSTVTQLDEIQTISFNNEVLVDIESDNVGTAYPVGNQEYPVNNIPDATAIVASKGFSILSIIKNITFGAGDIIDELLIKGQSPIRSSFTILTEASVLNSEFSFARVSGVLDGSAIFIECLVDGVEYATGFMQTCGLTENPIVLGGGAQASLIDCFSNVAGANTPTIDMNGVGQSLSVRHYNGGIRIKNRTGDDTASIDMNTGHVIIDATCTGDPIILRGSFKLTVEAGATQPDTSGRTAMQEDVFDVPNTVWNKVLP